jgi:hypothetical protein|nr:MAG TPA: major capsid protein [Microviridae sp.]
MANIRVRGHRFSDAPSMYMRRSKFDRSHVYKTTFNAGKLIPCFIDEVLPGDTGVLKVTDFARLATPVVPFMDNLYLDWFFFFVPCRLVWEHWQNFCFEQEDPDDSTDYVIPTVTLPGNSEAGTAGIGTVWDYFGLPTGLTVTSPAVSALPFRAYYLIWNEWFRDENLQNSFKVDKSDKNVIMNPDASKKPEWITGDFEFQLAPRGKRHDYFTSAFLWQQKGPGVGLPLSGNAPISMPSKDTPFNELFPSVTNYPYRASAQQTSTNNLQYTVATTGNEATEWSFADLSGVSSATISDLRTAFQMQKFYEKLARGGSRYTEILRSFFGVVSPDSRLQRPEYLGGYSKRININPIAQTSSTNDITPQGNLAAYGVTASRFHGFSKSFVEHGYIIGMCEVRADLTYQQGINKMWLRSTVYDFYWPTFAHLSEQAILMKEIYATGNPTEDDVVFGYQERYGEYRYKPSQITGKFRSTYPQSLDVWHLSQKFENAPQLSAEFIQDNPPINRIKAVQSEPDFLLDVEFNYKCIRPLPLFGTPGLVDHF